MEGKRLETETRKVQTLTIYNIDSSALDRELAMN